jgi:hypothetical protein
MKKLGFNGEAERQLKQESIDSINRVLEMFQDDMEVSNDTELAVMASHLLEAGANYTKTVRQLRGL